MEGRASDDRTANTRRTQANLETEPKVFFSALPAMGSICATDVVDGRRMDRGEKVSETEPNSSVVRPFRPGADHRSADVFQRPVSDARSDASVLGQSRNLASQYVDGNLARQSEAVDLVEPVIPATVKPLQLVPTSAVKPAKPTKAKAIKSSGKKAQPKDVNELTAILPEVPSGFWWEVASNAKGYKIDLRWRVQGKKTGQTFQRLGKHEYQSLMEETHATRCQLIADRLISELRADHRPERRQIAERLRAQTAHD